MVNEASSCTGVVVKRLLWERRPGAVALRADDAAEEAAVLRGVCAPAAGLFKIIDLCLKRSRLFNGS